MSDLMYILGVCSILLLFVIISIIYFIINKKIREKEEKENRNLFKDVEMIENLKEIDNKLYLSIINEEDILRFLDSIIDTAKNIHDAKRLNYLFDLFRKWRILLEKNYPETKYKVIIEQEVRKYRKNKKWI